ncbi:MAG: Xaa-Pro peptidase family protein [Halobacteria archaeon]|nr:Xaa-Pro peptidase family protein [Halobacteria archaeon]
MTHVLDDLLEREELDAYLQIDSSENSNMYYLSGFWADDAFQLLRISGETALLVSPLEYGRAKKEADADEVRSTGEFMSGDIRGSEEAQFEVLDRFLSEYGAETLGVPKDFSLHTAEELRERGYSVNTVEDVVMEARKSKSEEEIEHIRKAQEANERAMEVTERLIRESEVRDGTLYHDGEILTAEKVKTDFEIQLLRDRYSLSEAIVACGPKGADPHWRGSGPLRANEPIIVDIFPRHKSARYFGDMTRTFVKGQPDDRVQEMYDATLEAQEAAFEALKEGAGVTGEEVNDAVCDVYEERGYQTLRQSGNIESGFIHSTGHALGLDIHEPPRLGTGGEELKEGYVVTVEPGLYDPEIGGVRVEDLVIIRQDGFENLNDYHKELVID